MPINSAGAVPAWESRNDACDEPHAHSGGTVPSTGYCKPTRAKINFDIWYRKPLQILRRIENGDGGFIALATSCFLYEKYARAVIIESNPNKKTEKISQPEIQDQLIQDLRHDFEHVDSELCKKFWKVTRHGLAHHAMLQLKDDYGNRLPRWRLWGEFDYPIQWDPDMPGAIGIEPWRFMDWVLSLWDRKPELIDEDAAAPWGIVL